MAISYKLYQDKRQTSKYYNKWYAKAVSDELVELEQLAELIQRNCSVKRSDVNAVLTELSEVMRDQLLAGNRVKINGIGSFKVGFSSSPANSPEDWSPATNVKSTRINFSPETIDIISGGRRTRSAKALQGITFKELRKYNTPESTKGGE